MNLDTSQFCESQVSKCQMCGHDYTRKTKLGKHCPTCRVLAQRAYNKKSYEKIKEKKDANRIESNT